MSRQIAVDQVVEVLLPDGKWRPVKGIQIGDCELVQENAVVHDMKKCFLWWEDDHIFSVPITLLRGLKWRERGIMDKVMAGESD